MAISLSKPNNLVATGPAKTFWLELELVCDWNLLVDMELELVCDWNLLIKYEGGGPTGGLGSGTDGST